VNSLYIKHRLIVSRFGESLLYARHALSRFGYMRRPELALLREEEILMRKCFERDIPKDAVCVDVGGHIGSITGFFRKIAPQSKHIIVEASPAKAKWLRQAFPDYTLHAAAVSDAEGEVSFFENTTNSGYSSLTSRATRGRIKEITVPCTTLDRILAESPRIDLIKIDVEGFEYQVVKGCCEVIKRCRPRILFEAGAAADPEIDNENYIRLFHLFTEELGYVIRPVFGSYFGRPPIGIDEFMSCRTYPFTAFNFIAEAKG
jgi:FkbM family methyltransferase